MIHNLINKLTDRIANFHYGIDYPNSVKKWVVRHFFVSIFFSCYIGLGFSLFYVILGPITLTIKTLFFLVFSYIPFAILRTTLQGKNIISFSLLVQLSLISSLLYVSNFLTHQLKNPVFGSYLLNQHNYRIFFNLISNSYTLSTLSVAFPFVSLVILYGLYDLRNSILSEIALTKKIFTTIQDRKKLDSDTLELAIKKLETEKEFLQQKHLLEKERELQRIQSLSQQIEIFSSIQHELGNKLPAIKNEIKDLCDYFESKDGGNLLSDRIRVPIEGENIETIDTIKMVLNRIKGKLYYSIDSINSIANIIKCDPSKFHPTKLNLLPYLRDQCVKHSASKSKAVIRYSGDDEVKARIDTIQFPYLIENFISNANRHGNFDDPEKEYFILFRVYQDAYKVYIEIINNGKRLDDSLTIEDFIKPFSYYGNTGHSGLGGAIIANVIKGHGGEINLEKRLEENPEFKVCFKITLPKP